MPRELQPTSDSLPELTKAPTPKEEPQSAGGGLLDAILGQSNEKRDNLHPYTQSLTTSDIESCIKVEEATFPPNERCSREKVSVISLYQTICANVLCIFPSSHFHPRYVSLPFKQSDSRLFRHNPATCADSFFPRTLSTSHAVVAPLSVAHASSGYLTNSIEHSSSIDWRNAVSFAWASSLLTKRETS